jgi:hypothetical protein
MGMADNGVFCRRRQPSWLKRQQQLPREEEFDLALL